MRQSEEWKVELRRVGAQEERQAIIAMVEQHLRLQAHGHGASGATVLEHLMAELEERDRQAARSSDG